MIFPLENIGIKKYRLQYIYKKILEAIFLICFAINVLILSFYESKF